MLDKVGHRLKTVSNAIAVLRRLGAGEDALSLREIAKRTGLPKVTVFRLLSTLESEGLVAQEPRDGTYRLAVGLLALAGPLINYRGFGTIAFPLLKELRDTVQETVALNVAQDLHHVVVQVLPSPLPVRFVLDVGAAAALYLGAVGRAILAHKPEEVWERVIAETGLEPVTEKSITDPAALRRNLRQVRSVGYAVSFGERVRNAASIAAPVFDFGGDCVAAVSILVPEARGSDRYLAGLAAALTATTSKVSRALGYVHHAPAAAPPRRAASAMRAAR